MLVVVIFYIEIKKLMFSKNNQFSKNGFVINKLSQSSRLINKIVDNLPAKTKIPYSENVPWGYGNLIDNKI